MYRHHVEPRTNLYVPRKESFPISPKYIDVTRRTNLTLDVLLERRIDDFWNTTGGTSPLEPWTGFTKFTLLKEKPPDGYTWSGGHDLSNNKARMYMVRNVVKHVESSSAKKKAALDD